uniref:Uncharacterized protein n=1 Tax=Tetradesmus obliquus TaxID=3088 RepID=A0A383W8H4_TETOB|eukprot:jgi/Sobl393_1/11688/SZX73543.1
MNANVNADAVPLVLGLACRNSHLGSDLQAVCSLLRVSKAVQQAVLDACSGTGSSQLQVAIDGDANTAVAHGVGSPLQYLRRLSHQAQWLARHGGLVKQLSINKCTTIPHRDLSRDLDGADEAVVCLAVRPPVQLQELQLGQTHGSLLNPAAVLQQLDASHLTQLSVSIPVANYGAALMPAALQQLTALRCLRVFAGHHAPCPLQQPQILQAYLEALPRLTRLTELSWRGSISADLLKQLPARVLKVRLAMPTGKLEVQHLADKQQLQQLHLGFTGCDTTALASLSALTRLQHLSLHMPACKADSLTQHGSSLALSTLKQLHIGIHYADALSPAAASAIAAATSVSNLQLRCFRRFYGDLTAAFEPLVGLQRLCVMDVTFGAGGSLASFGTALTRGITHLVSCGTQLDHLHAASADHLHAHS